MSQKMEYTGKNSTTENWRFEDKTYSAKDGIVTVNDEHVAPLLATTVWTQVDQALPIPDSPFVAAKPGGDRSANLLKLDSKAENKGGTEDKTEAKLDGNKAEPRKDIK